MALGADQTEVHLEPVSGSGAAVTPNNASAQFRISSDGSVYTAPTTGVFEEEFTWLTGSGVASEYEVFIEELSGSFSGGTVGSWVSLSSSLTLGVSRNDDTPGTTVASGNILIRRASDEVQLAETTLSLSATVAAS